MALPVVDYIADYADYDSDNDDSSDDVVVVNTMGKSVPLEWYNVEDHIGYNVEGKKIDKLAREDQMSLLINRNRDDKSWCELMQQVNDMKIEEIVTITRRLVKVTRLMIGHKSL